MSERIEYASDMLTIVSWLRYEYDGLNLLRIDERYDGESPAGLDENDPWRPLNVFIHGPGAIGQIVKCKWYNYYLDGQNPTSCCDSGEYYYFYDVLGNVNGVLDDGGHYYRWEMDAFGNDLPSGNAFLAMDQPGPKEHLTGKMFDTTTGLYYFHARWYDATTGLFLSKDPDWVVYGKYSIGESIPTSLVDPSGREPIHPPPSGARDCAELNNWTGCCLAPPDLEERRQANQCVIEKLQAGLTPEDAYFDCKGASMNDPAHRKVGIGECYDAQGRITSYGGRITADTVRCDVWYVPQDNTCLDICACRVDQVGSRA